jgi:DDE domain
VNISSASSGCPAANLTVYLYRAIEQHGQVIDVLLSQRRDLAAARSTSHDSIFSSRSGTSGPTGAVQRGSSDL